VGITLPEMRRWFKIIIVYAETISRIDSKILLPSVLPSTESAALSGCGIIPKTFLPALQTPAIFSMAPLGFDSGVIFPFDPEII
jgi:hypothetical protein